MERWTKYKPFVVEPVSALELLYDERHRKRPRILQTQVQVREQLSTEKTHEQDKLRQQQQHQDTTCIPCFLQNPNWYLPLGITELAGPAGAGKTQLALSLCIDQVRTGQNKAVYLTLGGSGKRPLYTISRRCKGMLQERILHERSGNELWGGSPCHVEDILHGCLTRMFVRWIPNDEELFQVLEQQLPELLHAHYTYISSDDRNLDDRRISLVVLDSMANLFRMPDAGSGASNIRWHQERAVDFFRLSNLCKELSHNYEVPFLIVNEATTRIQPFIASNSGDKYTNNSQRTCTVLEPALGLAWAQSVNATFFVQRSTSNVHGEVDQQSLQVRRRRRLQCRKAPHLGRGQCQHFTIDRRGVVPLLQGSKNKSHLNT